MTGVTPWVHGGLSLGLAPVPGVPTLAQRLQEAGYVTGAVGDNFVLTERGAQGAFARGFGDFAFYPRAPAPWTAAAEKLEQWLPNALGRLASTSDLVAIADRWLRLHHEDPFFFWLHFYDPHGPYTPPAEFQPPGEPNPVVGEEWPPELLERLRTGTRSFTPSTVDYLRELYQAELRYVDDRVGQVLDTLRELGLYDETLIIVSSDHGEEFFEHGGFAHGFTDYEEQLLVPWLIKAPGAAAQREKRPVSTIDLPPTMLQLLDVPYEPAEMQGVSQACAVRGEACPIPSDERPFFSAGTFVGRPLQSVRFGRWKLIRAPEFEAGELYDLESDPGEQLDLARERPEVVEQGLALLEAHAAESAALRRRLGVGDPAAGEISPDDRRRLRSLGYVQ